MFLAEALVVADFNCRDLKVVANECKIQIGFSQMK